MGYNRMKIYRKQMFAAISSLGMAALLATTSVAQAPDGGARQGDEGQPRGEQTEGDRPRGERAEGDRPRGERAEGDRPRGDRRDGDRPAGGPGGPGGFGGPRPEPTAVAQMML